MKVTNKNRHFNANEEYILGFVNFTPVLFTKSQYNIARERALKNKEDTRKVWLVHPFSYFFVGLTVGLAPLITIITII